jgi:cytochrome-b5 reductase
MLRGSCRNWKQCAHWQYRSFATNHSQPPSKSRRFVGLTLIVAGSSYLGWQYLQWSKQGVLDTNQYVPLTLMKKEQISPDSFLLRVSTKQQSKDYPVPSCLYIKDDTIQIMRPYTPINANPYKDGYIDLVVKRYQRGSVSRTLSGFEPNDLIHVRGPMTEEYEYKENTLDEIGMVSVLVLTDGIYNADNAQIAGGTGISPMYQIIRRVLDNPQDQKTRLWLIYGNKTEQDILLKKELDALQAKYADRLKVKYVLEKPTEGYEQGYVTDKMIKEMMLGGDKRRIFVCGPNEMLALVCGERARDYSQGQVTGILARLGLTSNEIWKFQ